MAEQYISLKVVQDRLTKHPLLQSLSLDDIITYTIDLMRIVGVPAIFEDKIVTLQTDNYKIKLPCDYYAINQMRGRYGMYRYSTDTFHLKQRKENYAETKCDCRPIKQVRVNCEQCETCPHRDVCEYYQFDYNQSECISLLKSVTVPDQTLSRTNTFVVQNGYIILSNRSDIVDLSYQAIKTDENGLPMIPDNSNFIRALIAYIKKEYFTILFDLNSVSPQILQQAQQDYAWAVGSCETDMLKLDISKAEAFFNSARTIIQKTNEYQTGFRTNGSPVIFKTH